MVIIPVPLSATTAAVVIAILASIVVFVVSIPMTSKWGKQKNVVLVGLGVVGDGDDLPPVVNSVGGDLAWAIDGERCGYDPAADPS